MRFLVKARTTVILMALIVLPGLVGCTVVVRDWDGPHRHRHYDEFSFEYYYYPSARVYFHIYSGYYYYYTGHRWIRTRTLPGHIHLHRGERYKFKSRDRYPYKKYDEHRQKFKSKPGLKYDGGFDRNERELNRKRWQEYRGRREDSSRNDNGSPGNRRFRHENDSPASGKRYERKEHQYKDKRRDEKEYKEKRRERSDDRKERNKDEDRDNGKRFKH